MRVDEAGEDVLPRGVDHLVGLDVERLADEGDPLVLDEDVADVVVGRRDHAASFDQNGTHCGSPFIGRTRARSAYSPPSVTSTFSFCQLSPVTSTSSSFKLVDGRLGEVGPVRVLAGRALDHLAAQGDVVRDLERVRIHDPDPVRGRPDQRVDLVQLPALVALTQRRPVVEHDAEAVLRVVAAVDPAAEARLQEPLRDVLVVLVGDPVALDEDAVLERTGTEVRHLHHVQLVHRVELPGVLVLRLQHLGELVVGHRRRRVDLAVQEEVHVERLRDDLRVLLRVDPVLVQRREQLVLVAAEPDADLLARGGR